MEMKEIYDKMVEKAKADENFKKRLLSNPKEALKKELGIDFGKDVNVSVYESTPDHRHYVIPLEA